MKDILLRLSKDDYKSVIDEITEWKNTGSLKKDGLVRDIYEEYSFLMGFEPYRGGQLSIDLMKELIPYHICKILLSE